MSSLDCVSRYTLMPRFRRKRPGILFRSGYRIPLVPKGGRDGV